MAEIQRPRFRLTPGEHRAILIVGDLLMGAIALLGGIYFWFIVDPDFFNFFEFFIARAPFWFYILPPAWMLLLIDLYDLHRAANWQRTLRGVTIAAMVGGIVYLVVFFLQDDPRFINRRTFAAFLLLVYVLTLLWRRLYIRMYAAQGLSRRVLVVGAGANGHSLAKMYLGLKPPPFNLVGYIDDDPEKIGTEVEGFRVYGSSDQLLRFIEELNITEVVVAITGEMRGQTFQTLLDVQEKGIEVTRMQKLYEDLLGRVPIHHLESDWVLRSFIDEARVSAFYLIASRALDILGALVGLTLFLALLPFLAIAILLDDGWPIFYTQPRLGKGGVPFKMLKLRTMVKDAEADGKARMAAENDPRVTRVGAFLRATRLDELPQFWNVLRGEMSLVGPRAEREEMVNKFQKQIPFYRARLLAKPGLTGWAQINYGYAATVEDTGVKLEYDLYYIKHRSILMDLVIILRTVGTVLGRKGR
ncbi:MAG: sugar transferase [Anaerolineales bacterium]|nr:sugar transferase [Anaerolineales bacterium]MCX7754069.1 sugar transferase [Anaerolineales bacterium]MDW8276725.1 sugar transferase [Anaerolineales bacterium]